MSKIVKEKKLTKAQLKELEIQAEIVEPRQAPVEPKDPEFIVEFEDVKELNEYLGLVSAATQKGVLDHKSALEGLIGRVTNIIKVKE